MEFGLPFYCVADGKNKTQFRKAIKKLTIFFARHQYAIS